MRGMPAIVAAELTVDELHAEIAEREALVRTMVGTLYPGIIKDEIKDIRVIITAQRSYEKDRIALEHAKCSDCNGTGKQNDAEPGDIGYEEWTCTVCGGTGYA